MGPTALAAGMIPGARWRRPCARWAARRRSTRASRRRPWRPRGALDLRGAPGRAPRPGGPQDERGGAGGGSGTAPRAPGRARAGQHPRAAGGGAGRGDRPRFGGRDLVDAYDPDRRDADGAPGARGSAARQRPGAREPLGHRARHLRDAFAGVRALQSAATQERGVLGPQGLNGGRRTHDFELPGLVFAGIAGGGMASLARRLVRRLPGWIVPVAAAGTMILAAVSLEHIWYGRTTAALPPRRGGARAQERRASATLDLSQPVCGPLRGGAQGLSADPRRRPQPAHRGCPGVRPLDAHAPRARGF